MELAHQEAMKNLKMVASSIGPTYYHVFPFGSQEHAKELTATREEFESLSKGSNLGFFFFFLAETKSVLFYCSSFIKLVELQKKHEVKMQTLRDELELRRRTEIHEIEEVCKLDPWKAILYSYCLPPSARMVRLIL